MAETSGIEPRLKCRDLCQQYSGRPILSGVSLHIMPGETLAVMGKSGSGKSTLLRSISLLEEPVSGDAWLEGQMYMQHGQPLFAPWQIRSQIGMVFQEFNLFAHMTALENITLALEKTRKMARREARDAAVSMANRLGIERVLNQYPETLSGGEAQRVALARAMLLRPSVLLLDEITSALDPESVSYVVEAIRHIRSLDERGGLGIMLVTHFLRFATEFADRIAFLHEGSILEEWPAAEFPRLCEQPETRDFVSRHSAVL